LNLNGTWRFAFDDHDMGEKKKWYDCFPEGMEILVPYTYETNMSTIGDQRFHPVVWYQRSVDLASSSGRVLLHLEGADVVGPLPPAIQLATVFSAALCTAARHPGAARSLLAFLASPDADAAKRVQGMEPA
jgi:ABC-type molybdate transport system substrate-binding protein